MCVPVCTALHKEKGRSTPSSERVKVEGHNSLCVRVCRCPWVQEYVCVFVCVQGCQSVF